MNKKRLSVVMAGAMLATSVAPVMAAEVTKEERSANELGLLQKELRELLPTKVFSEGDALEGQSVYAIYVNGKDTGLSLTSQQSQWQRVFNSLDTGDVVEVYSKGFKEENGKVLSKEYKEAVYGKYETAEQLKDLKEAINALTTPSSGKLSGLLAQNAATFDENSQRVVVTFKEDIGHLGASNNSIVIGLGDDLINPEQYKNAAGKPVNVSSTITAKEFYGFAKAAPIVAAGAQDIPGSAVRHITITPGGYDLAVTDLYDGLMLTTEGHDFFTLLNESIAAGRTVTVKGNDGTPATTITNELTAKSAIKLVNGKARFSVTISAVSGGVAAETYTITGANEKHAERLAQWIAENLPRVDIIAGDNRYETAVTVARAYAGLTGENVSNAFDGAEGQKVNVVLVNGESLVDGLAAAPLAAKLGRTDYKAPILLTESNKLPKETKAYLKEVIANVKVGKLNEVTANLVGGKTVLNKELILLTESNKLPKETKAYLKEVIANVKVGKLNEVTANLVGGKTVLNKELENELRDLGFNVVRYGGDNREETSLEVAKAVNPNFNKAFVVGGEGEADAMSIAAIAAQQKAPILVGKKGGVSQDLTYALRGKNVDVTVVGGEGVVTKADFKALKSEAKSVIRVHGSNRQATNAEIIKKYYKGSFATNKNVIVVKDGQRNKAELIDALAASNMAVEKNAPIVLATSKISKAQEDALELNGVGAKTLYQVGHGVARDVVKTIAENLGLADR